eukprot:TRINITY_DN34069_c0_g1_i1.p1 TRINITY_DN34069_c0_g1~~TRINITY_DN34069_c0_g1_i1.p1  ORF type:complete len:199 (+),score=30.20 TRINITY_DN34069_c0_g1_i1:162-758(+)
MASAHAHCWSQHGLKVFIGSQSRAQGRRAAEAIGQGCQGGGHVDMIRASNFIMLCIDPGQPSAEFLDNYRDEFLGQGKMFVDMSAPFAAASSQELQQCMHPHNDHVSFLKARLNDPSASFVKAWANVMAREIRDNRQQPVEVAGDPEAKSVAIRLLNRAGFEPIDCGGPEDIPKIEPGFHERRWRHPRHLAFNGPDHP